MNLYINNEFQFDANISLSDTVEVPLLTNFIITGEIKTALGEREISHICIANNEFRIFTKEV